ncbi:zf-TFIIB domain-containing protein [Nocardia terpenica]|uniref:Transcription factor zinc-finger domain-containing protein n=1 Tax=Nocardia terpenica TaxID=455432 RepID=A0A6G9Z472_9NOCA|nr:zf-TFIIB domain-containing protein [Nocardia terpenica]QIS20405.1 hypothetical protein F6W96_21000 [Nocardia terpenica]
MSAGSTLACPRGDGELLAIQRFGVQLRKCTGCAALFLEEADLSRLAAAQADFEQPQYPAAPPQYPAGRGGMFDRFLGGGHGGYGGGRRGHH